MADVADHANDQIERELESLLQAHSARAALAAQSRSLDGCCIDCDGDIGEARRRALPMTNRCIDCARIAETHCREVAWRSA